MFRKYIAALAAAFILAIQILPGVSLAAWSGQTWQGNTWQGETWEGPTWEGNATRGNDWSGEAGSLDGWSRDAWRGHSFNGQGNGGGQAFAGNDFNGSDFRGGLPSYPGAPVIDGFRGQDFRGLPTGPTPIADHFSFQGPASSQLGAHAGQTTAGVETNAPDGAEKVPQWDGYDIAKLFIDDVGMGTIDLVAELAAMDDGGLSPYGWSRAGLLVSGYNVFTRGHEGAQAVGDLMSAGLDTAGTIKSFNEFRQLTLGTAGTEAAMLSQASAASRAAAPAVSTLAKVNAVTGVVGLGFSTYDFVQNVSRAAKSTGAERTDAIVDSAGSFGGMLMSGGAIVAAIPGAQAIGVGMMAVGGAISVGAAVVKFFRRKPVKEAIANGWKKVTSFFGFGS